MQPAVEITIRIDEVVLEGVPASDWRRVEEALRWELERLFERHGVPEGVGEGLELADVDAGELELRPGLTPQAIGRRLARALHQGLQG